MFDGFPKCHVRLPERISAGRVGSLFLVDSGINNQYSLDTVMVNGWNSDYG